MLVVHTIVSRAHKSKMIILSSFIKKSDSWPQTQSSINLNLRSWPKVWQTYFFLSTLISWTSSDYSIYFLDQSGIIITICIKYKNYNLLVMDVRKKLCWLVILNSRKWDLRFPISSGFRFQIYFYHFMTFQIIFICYSFSIFYSTEWHESIRLVEKHFLYEDNFCPKITFKSSQYLIMLHFDSRGT